MSLILVRHVETIANIKKVFSGNTDFPITKNGKNQLYFLSNKLKSEKIDYIISSPLKRAKYTALELSKLFNKNIKYDDRIKEIDFGKFEGKNIEEIQHEFPEEYKRWMENYKKYCFPNGECFLNFYNRIKSFVDELQKNKSYLIITHGGVIRLIYILINNLEIDDMWKIKCKTGHYIEIKWRDIYKS
ncbi:alpha-ribazole phosphatase [Marinitoga arctica]